MKLRNGISGLFLVLLLICSSAAWTAPITFDTDNEGWEQAYIGRPAGAAYDQIFPVSGADWRATGGNPDGNIYQNATGSDQRSYWMGYRGAGNFLGDLTGRYLQTDIYSTGNWQTLANGSYGDDGNVYARWVISNKLDNGNYNMFVSKQNASIDINTFTGWTTSSITLEEDNFFRWPNLADNSQDFSEVLQDYDSIGLYIFSGTDVLSNINGGTGTWNSASQLLHYGGFSSDGNTATWALDNFQAKPVPEPATLLLFGTGLLGFAGIRRKQS